MKEYKETAGQDFVKKIRPAGCILFLFLMVAVLLICFTSGKNPIPGYEAPESTEFYSAHLDQLQTELQQQVFPALEGIEGSEIANGKLVVTIDEENFAVTRAAILRYFDVSLFEFVEPSE